MSARRYVIAVGPAVAVVLVAGGWVMLGHQFRSPGHAPNLTARVDQYRAEEPLHQLRLTFGNREREPVLVETLQLISPDFKVLPPGQQNYALPAGGTIEVGLPTKYGPAVCRGEVPTVARPARAVLRIRTPNGSTADYSYPLADEHDLLGRLLRVDCEAQKIDSTVQLTYGNTWDITTTAAGEPAVRTELSARLKDSGAKVELIRLRGSVLFGINAAAEPIARLDAATPVIHAPLFVTKNGRCTAHELTGSQQTYIFRIWIAVDGGEPLSTTLNPNAKARQTLARLITTVCDANR